MKKITKIETSQHIPTVTEKRKVAAYCRVSTSSDAQLESLEAQISHYETFINSREDWQFVGVYYDKGISGTKKDTRPELMRLIKDCKSGKINFIITKSISRFSRNTVDCLELVRMLLALDVPIYFEKENLNTGSMNSELFLSLLASLAENESISTSENTKWSVQQRFKTGTYKISYPPYGYNWDGIKMTVNTEQATIVKEIFAWLLAGKSPQNIADLLNERAIKPKRGKQWKASTIRDMATNEKYTGDCLFQKTYSDAQFKRHINRGEMTQYLMREHHPALISHEDFNAVQALIQQRAAEKGIRSGSTKYLNRYSFSGKLICGECGNTFKRRIHYSKARNYIAWCCQTHLRNKMKCSMRFIRDDTVQQAFLRMVNKLIFSRNQLLRPYVQAIKNNLSDGALQRIQTLQSHLTENTEKREILVKLMAQDMIDLGIFTKENNALLAQSEVYRSKIEKLQQSQATAGNYIKEAVSLLRRLDNTSYLSDFDETVFEDIVEQVTIHNRMEIRFTLTCGLTLIERMN